MNKKYLSREEAIAKARHFCAYQERCHSEVRTRLLDWGLRGQDLEEIILHLIEENFLNEERFARAYARGKFRMNQWGKQKIRMALRTKQVSDYCIEQALAGIPEDEYRSVIRQEIAKKQRSLKGLQDYQRKFKVVQYLAGKGFEPALVQKELGGEAE